METKVSETAADIRFYDTDSAPVDAQRLADDTADDMRDLSGGGDVDAIAFHFRIADKVLDMTMLDRRSVIPAFYFDQAGFFDRLFIVSLADRCVFQDVVRIFLVDLRRVVLHGFLHIHDKRVFFVFYFDGAESLCGSHFILGYNGGDIISVKTDFFGQDQSVGHVLVRRVCGPGMSCGGEIVFLPDVKTGKDSYNARDLLRLGSINGYDPSVCDRGMKNPCDISAFIAQVIGISGAADDFVMRVYTCYFFYLHTSLFLLFND